MVWEGACLRGMGYGASLEEASADAMNDLMRKAYQNERDLDACDTAFEAERTPTERPPGS